jgi:NAD(P)H-flavin reductase
MRNGVGPLSDNCSGYCCNGPFDGTLTIPPTYCFLKSRHILPAFHSYFTDASGRYYRYPMMLLVGGGIGITPIMSALKDIYDYGLPANQHNSVPHAITTVYFMWVIPAIGEYDIFKKEVEEIIENAKSPFRPKLEVAIYVTRSKEELTPPFQSGRPKIQKVFDTMMDNHPNKPGLVFACGPTPLISELWDNSIQYTMKGRLVDFHHEVFDF